MKASKRSWALALALGLAISPLPGCALFHPRPKSGATPGPQLVGTVALVNETLHFVLVDVSAISTPSVGQALKSFSPSGAESAILTVSPEKARPFMIADIVKGEPRKGDEVYQ